MRMRTLAAAFVGIAAAAALAQPASAASATTSATFRAASVAVTYDYDAQPGDVTVKGTLKTKANVCYSLSSGLFWGINPQTTWAEVANTCKKSSFDTTVPAPPFKDSAAILRICMLPKYGAPACGGSFALARPAKRAYSLGTSGSAASVAGTSAPILGTDGQLNGYQVDGTFRIQAGRTCAVMQNTMNGPTDGLVWTALLQDETPVATCTNGTSFDTSVGRLRGSFAPSVRLCTGATVAEATANAAANRNCTAGTQLA